MRGSSLHFLNVNVDVGEKKILNNVSGLILPGQICAILGPSGAGKSSLLDVLARRPMNEAKVTGEVFMKQQVATPQIAMSLCGYVRQEDVILASCTVRETLQYAARLKMGGSVETSVLYAKIESLIRELGLLKCADTLVGSALIRGVSGGEKKRLAVALELLTNPEILFLDEPTTGLDSSTAFGLIRTLRESATSNQLTVVCTIHQPRVEIFELFDTILLLTEGNAVYHGPTPGAVPVFSSMGFTCPKYENPAVYYLELLQTDRGAGQVGMPPDVRAKLVEQCSHQVLERIQNMITASEQGTSSASVDGAAILQVDGNSFKENSISISKHTPAPFWTQCIILTVRSFRHSYRDQLIAVGTLFQYIFFALFFGALYANVDDTQQGAQDRSTVLFQCVGMIGSIPLFSVVAYYPSERAVFNREQSAKLYHVLAYYIGLSLSTVPLQVICVLIFSSMLYFMVGLANTAGQFFTFFGVMLIVAFFSEAAGLAISAMAPTFDLGNGIASLVYMLWLMFSGFYVSTKNIVDAFGWVKYTSYIYFGSEALLENDFDGLKFTCENTECVIPDDEIYIPEYNVTVNARDVYGCPTTCLYPDGDSFREAIGFNNRPISENVAILIGMTIGFKVITYLVLKHFVIGKT